jgi:hypothetical protein
VEYEQKTKGVHNLPFSGNHAHSSQEKVTIVVDVPMWNMVGIYHWMTLIGPKDTVVYPSALLFIFSHQ